MSCIAISSEMLETSLASPPRSCCAAYKLTSGQRPKMLQSVPELLLGRTQVLGQLVVAIVVAPILPLLPAFAQTIPAAFTCDAAFRSLNSQKALSKVRVSSETEASMQLAEKSQRKFKRGVVHKKSSLS